MSVDIWCPGCNKKYKVPAGSNDKRFKCKRCERKFLAGEALSPNQSLGDDVPVATLVDADDSVSTNQSSSRSTGQPEDLSQYFNHAPAGAHRLPPDNAEPRHIGNPLIIFAVLGAILFSLFLGFTFSVISIAYQVHLAAVEANKNQEQRDAVGLVQDDQRPENNFRETVESSAAENGLAETRTVSNPPERITSAGNSRDPSQPNPETSSFTERPPTGDARKMDSHEAAESNAESERRREESNKRREAERIEREKRMETARIAREKREKEREEKERIEEEQKKRFSDLSEIADSKPMDGLVARVEVVGWGVKSLALSQDNLLFMAMPGRLEVHNWKLNKLVTKIERKPGLGGYSLVSLNSEGTLLSAGKDNGEIEMYKVDRDGKLELLKTLNEHTKRLVNLTFSADDSRWISVDSSYKIGIWDVSSQTNVAMIDSRLRRIIAIQTSNEGQDVRLTDGKKWESFRLSDGEAVESGEYSFWVSGPATYLPDGSNLIAATGSNIKFLSDGDSKPIFELKSKGVQWTFALSGDAKLYSGGDRHIYEWDINERQLSHVWSLPDVAYVQKLALSPDGSTMAASYGSTSQDVYVFDLNDR